LAEELSVSIEVGDRVLQSISDVFSKRLFQGKRVKLQGFGTFGVRAVETEGDAQEKDSKPHFVLPSNPGPYFKLSKELKWLAKSTQAAMTKSWKRSKRAGRQP
jgi:nucleoid DNA-binding protein